ncbi:hypothetical protein H5410_022222 [Solanum commersonii]|uniref:Uncharacterized protein n=1 Tax=Solanum commersonii TaxID=4109 RepID=A0A9J5ZEU7_SOLCO|nr:hypothetical protein H5410_022222 [Solanum commersonii]
MLNKYHKFSFMALLEHFQHTKHINRYRSRLQMPLMFHDYNGKIWLFVNHGFTTTLISDTKQQSSLNLFLTRALNHLCEDNAFEYERESGQKANKDKSLFYMHQNSSREVVHQIELDTCMTKGTFPLKDKKEQTLVYME